MARTFLCVCRGNQRAAIWFRTQVYAYRAGIAWAMGWFVASRGRQGDIFSLVQNTPKRSVKDEGKARLQGKDRDMGSALRSIYLKTIEETVPAEMLDLLGKLD